MPNPYATKSQSTQEIRYYELTRSYSHQTPHDNLCHPIRRRLNRRAYDRAGTSNDDTAASPSTKRETRDKERSDAGSKRIATGNHWNCPVVCRVTHCLEKRGMGEDAS